MKVRKLYILQWALGQITYNIFNSEPGKYEDIQEAVENLFEPSAWEILSFLLLIGYIPSLPYILRILSPYRSTALSPKHPPTWNNPCAFCKTQPVHREQAKARPYASHEARARERSSEYVLRSVSSKNTVHWCVCYFPSEWQTTQSICLLYNEKVIFVE